MMGTTTIAAAIKIVIIIALTMMIVPYNHPHHTQDKTMMPTTAIHTYQSDLIETFESVLTTSLFPLSGLGVSTPGEVTVPGTQGLTQW